VHAHGHDHADGVDRRARQAPLRLALGLTAGFLVLEVAGALVTGILANGASAWVLHRDAAENLNVRGAFVHVLGDIVALLGTIAGALVMLATGWPYADPIASVLIGVLVLVSGWGILRESVDLLLEARRPAALRSTTSRGRCARCPAWRACTTCTSGRSPPASWP
jgi:cobalt-zinc-cadmium efflux system protein